MAALEKLNKLSVDIYAEALRVKKDYQTSAQALELMAKYGCKKIEDAVYAEALNRLGV